MGVFLYLLVPVVWVAKLHEIWKVADRAIHHAICERELRHKANGRPPPKWVIWTGFAVLLSWSALSLALVLGPALLLALALNRLGEATTRAIKDFVHSL